MSGQKSGWDILSEFGRIGLISLVVAVLVLWGLIHTVAQPGTSISFALFSYTKPTDKSVVEIKLIQQLMITLSAMGVSATFAEPPCESMKIESLSGEDLKRVSSGKLFEYEDWDDVASATFNISDSVFLLETGGDEYLFRDSTKTVVVEYEGLLELAWQGMQTSMAFQNLKSFCSGNPALPIDFTKMHEVDL